MKRWIAFVLIAMLLLVGAAGCDSDSGEPDQDIYDDENGMEDEAPDTGGGDDLKEFFNFGTVFDLAAAFKELGWSYMGQNVVYLFQGQDAVNGASAEYIQINAGSAIFDIWVASDGEILKAVVDGQELPPEAAQAAQAMFGLLEVVIDEQQWDRKWAGGEQTDASRDLGAGTVKITRYDWRIAGMPVYIEVDVAEIAGRNLMVKLWQYANDGTPISGWELYRVIPR